jgi:hypothetical protein
MPRKPLIGEVDPQALVDRLAFTQEETQDAAMEQPKLFMAAATYRIKKMRTRLEAEMHLDNLRVDYSLKMRFKHKGQKGMTERAIQELVDRVPEIRQATVEAAKAKRLEEWAKLMLDAYEHRRSSIKVITQFAFMQDTFSGQYEVDKMKKQRDRLKRDMGKDEEIL